MTRDSVCRTSGLVEVLISDLWRSQAVTGFGELVAGLVTGSRLLGSCGSGLWAHDVSVDGQPEAQRQPFVSEIVPPTPSSTAPTCVISGKEWRVLPSGHRLVSQLRVMHIRKKLCRCVAECRTPFKLIGPAGVHVSYRIMRAARPG